MTTQCLLFTFQFTNIVLWLCNGNNWTLKWVSMLKSIVNINNAARTQMNVALMFHNKILIIPCFRQLWSLVDTPYVAGARCSACPRICSKGLCASSKCGIRINQLRYIEEFLCRLRFIISTYILILNSDRLVLGEQYIQIYDDVRDFSGQ